MPLWAENPTVAHVDLTHEYIYIYRTVCNDGYGHQSIPPIHETKFKINKASNSDVGLALKRIQDKFGLYNPNNLISRLDFTITHAYTELFSADCTRTNRN